MGRVIVPRCFWSDKFSNLMRKSRSQCTNLLKWMSSSNRKLLKVWQHLTLDFCCTGAWLTNVWLINFIPLLVLWPYPGMQTSHFYSSHHLSPGRWQRAKWDSDMLSVWADILRIKSNGRFRVWESSVHLEVFITLSTGTLNINLGVSSGFGRAVIWKNAMPVQCHFSRLLVCHLRMREQTSQDKTKLNVRRRAPFSCFLTFSSSD